MKTIFLLVALTISGVVSAQKFSSAVEYNDHIVGLQNEIGRKMIAFNENVGMDGSTMETVKPYFDDMLATTRDVVKRLEKVQPWEKNTEIKNAALELFRFYEVTIDKDYRRMVDIVYGPNEMTEESLGELGTILEKVTNSEKEYDERFQTAQKAFAVKYNISLEENEIQKEFDKN